MTIRQIETFITLAETKSFTETANKLFLSQPAVSQQIRALENDINCRLFIRSKSGITLSPAGIVFYDEAASLLSHTKSVYQKLRQSDSGEKTVRTLCYLPALRILAKICSEFSATHPEIQLNISRVDVLEMNSQMVFEQHDISIALGEPDKKYDRLRFIPLYSCDTVCIMHKGHPLAEKEFLQMTDLIGQTIYSINEHPNNSILHQINAFFQSSHNASFYHTLFSFYDASVMAATGNCICIVPDVGDPSAYGCVKRPLELPIKHTIGLYISENAPQDILDFCEIAQRLASEDPEAPVIY